MSRVCTGVLVALTACLIVAGNVWAADPPAEKAGRKGDPAANRERLAEQAKEAFAKLDKDANGQVTLEEFGGGRRKADAGKSEAMFKLLDANKDGSVSLEEFTTKPVEYRFQMMDKDGDGVVTLEEAKGNRKQADGGEQSSRVEELIARMDTNGDKKVTLEEFKAAQPKKRAGQGAKKKEGGQRKAKKAKNAE